MTTGKDYFLPCGPYQLVRLLFDHLFFTDKDRLIGGVLENILECSLQHQETSDLTSECTDNVYPLDSQKFMGNSKVFTGSTQYKMYTNMISEIIN